MAQPEVQTMPKKGLQGGGRIGAIDLARGVAVVLMIAAHASDAFLADEWKGNDIWYLVDLLFGFVAPAFTFLSGVAFSIAIERRAQRTAERGDDHPWRPLVGKLLVILLLGYWIQIPNLSLRQLIWGRRPEELARLFDANILQVIALSGLLALALARWLGPVQRARRAALLVGVAGIIAAPYLWKSDLYLSLPLPIRFYLAPSPPATFPLLPSLAYFMLGLALAPALIEAGRTWGGVARLFIVGGVLVAIGFALDLPLHSVPPFDDFWRSSPQHGIFRVGGLLVMLALCHVAVTRRRHGEFLEYVGRRSLAIYLLHLMLFYGSPVTMGMRYWYNASLGRALGPFSVGAIVLETLLLTALAVRLWQHLTERRPEWGRRIAWLAWGGFALLFMLKP